MKYSLLLVMIIIVVFAVRHVRAQNPPPASQTWKSIYDIPVDPMRKTTDTLATLESYRGKVILIVNVASRCGFTGQYEGLEKLHRTYKDQGLAVLGFPSNDFMGQEPGTNEEILQFCKTKYDVTFPLYAKIKVKGNGAAPLYDYLTRGDHAHRGEISWNFNKFLIGRDGKIIQRYGSKTKPDDPELVKAIEDELKKKPVK